MTHGAVEGTFELERFLAGERVRVEEALAALGSRHSPDPATPLGAAVGYALATRGKRLRPILCVAAWRALRGDAEAPAAVYRLACALEIVHTYSLVHDDLPCMDDDDLRRGRPTVHRVHGAPLATLAGAALIPVAMTVVVEEARWLGLSDTETGRMVREICRASGATGMVGGQLLDLEGEQRAVDAAGLEAIHRAKTGALLEAALRVGALAARGTEAELAAVTEYGGSLGLAFQITDDVLDVTASSETLGKTPGRDESLGKSTYPALFGLDGARALAQERAGEAVAALDRAGIRSAELEALARYVVEREV